MRSTGFAASPRLAAAAAAFLALLALAPGAGAQTSPMVAPVIGPPQVVWLDLGGGPTDANGAHGGSSDERVPSVVLEAVRGGLFDGSMPAPREPGCGSHVEATGTATAGVPGFAVQRAAAVRLVPRLTLAGFTRGGCAIGAGLAGALVYATPIRKDIWLAVSAGILHIPHPGAGETTVTREQVRADIVFARPGGRSYSVGVTSTLGLLFGGVW